MSSPQTAQPLISICMPTYNRAHMVGLAIDAVLNQTRKNIELIIVNDGSRDSTQQVLAEYAKRDSRVRVINKENEGIPETVNRGWKAATGEFVTWTSDDNIYHLNALEVMATYLAQHPDVTLVYADHRDIDGEGNLIGYPKCHNPEALETDSVIYGCVLFRRAIFDHTEMFRKQWKRCHDFEFYRRVYKAYKVARIPQVLYDYRRHDASMTGDHFAITTEHAELLSSVAETSVFRHAAWGWCWNEIARQAEREGRPVKAAWYAIKAAIQEGTRTPTALNYCKKALYSLTPPPIRVLRRIVRLPRGIKA